MFCGEQSILATSHFGQVAAPVKCKRWGCPNCADWKQRCLMAQAMEGKPNRHIVFTCRRGQYTGPLETARAMVAAWRTIVQRWRRLRPYHRCEYMCVFEPHQSGWPHMHILWKGHWIDQKWLAEQATELLNSPNQTVNKIADAKAAAAYVSKYFSKEPTKFGTCKRFWTSQGWPKIKHLDGTKAFHKGFPIDLVNRRVSDIVAEWIRYGKTVWTRPPDVCGWGCLWEPERKKPPRKEAARPWRTLIGGRPLGERRALRARRRGVHV